MKIGDIVNYQNFVAVVISNRPLAIATNQGTTLPVEERDLTLLLSRSFVLEEFSKRAALGNIGGHKFTKGSVVVCNDLVGYVVKTDKNQVCIVDSEGVERWVFSKLTRELSNPHALAALLYLKVVKGK